MTELNKTLFKIKMLENKVNVAELAKELDVDKQTIYNRLNGRTPFTLQEVRFLRNKFNLTDDEVVEIFLN